MKSEPKFTKSEIKTVNSGYQKHLEGQNIFHNNAVMRFKKRYELKFNL